MHVSGNKFKCPSTHPCIKQRIEKVVNNQKLRMQGNCVKARVASTIMAALARRQVA